MDLTALREATIEATQRALHDKLGFVPDEDSDEWEEEYRRQFTTLKQRFATQPMPVRQQAAPAAALRGPMPELTGEPEQIRWAATIRDQRLREITSEPFRVWVARTWTRAKLWVDTRDVPAPVLMQRYRTQFDEYRQKVVEAGKARTADAQKKAAEIAAYQKKLADARITPEGLVELIDASERFDAAPLAAKLADVTVDGRHLRIFESTDPNVLLVKEKRGPLQQPDYAIERDEGLVADLKLFAQAPA